jgi:ABC-type transport system substrate-binding protein
LNNSFWWSPKVEALYTEAHALTDPAARLAKYDEIQATVMDAAPYVTLCSPITTTMCSKRVSGFYNNLVFGYDPAHYWIKRPGAASRATRIWGMAEANDR